MKTIIGRLFVLVASAMTLGAAHAQNPVLSYSALFGQTKGDAARDVAVDKNNGNIYVVGNTRLSGLATPGAFQTTNAGGNLYGDGFVAKFDSTGSNLLYFTYLGGIGDEAVLGLALGSDGSAYVTGATTSTNFPTNPLLSQSAIRAVSNPKKHIYSYDAFITKLSPDGSMLDYSTYLPSTTNNDQGVAISLDPAENAYVAGFTDLSGSDLTNFPSAGTDDAFVAKVGFSNGLPVLNYLTFILGNGADHAEGIAAGSDGSVFVTGYTTSGNFPTTTNALQTLLNGSTNTTSSADAFITKLDPSGASVLFSTLLGGEGNDYGFKIVLDSAGDAYVTGSEDSDDFPGTTNFLNSSKGSSRAFLTKLSSSDGVNYTTNYSVIFGGKGINEGIGLAVDTDNNAYVVGATTAKKDFPTNNIPDTARGKNAGSQDVFVSKFDPGATNLLYSFYLGGSKNDLPFAIAVLNGTACVVGQTYSIKFPQANAAPRKLLGKTDAFITIISPPTVPVIPPPPQ